MNIRILWFSFIMEIQEKEDSLLYKEEMMSDSEDCSSDKDPLAFDDDEAENFEESSDNYKIESMSPEDHAPSSLVTCFVKEERLFEDEEEPFDENNYEEENVLKEDAVPISFVACDMKEEFITDNLEEISEDTDGFKSDLTENEARHVCSECSKSFYVLSDLHHHQQSHVNTLKPYKCFQCNEAFSLQSGLSLHMKMHKGLKSFTCGECNETFSPSSDFDNSFSDLVYKHMRSHASKKPVENLLKPLECDSYLMKDQSFSHISENTYVCTLCHATFSRPEVLKDHLRLHDTFKGVKPFTCAVCNETISPFDDVSMSFNDLVYMHMRSHNLKKEFKCKECNQEFPVASLLEDHMLSHKSLKTHKCVECNQTFSKPKQLKDHVLCSHAGVKPFKCTECSCAYSNVSSLNAHMKSHQIYLLRCVECEEPFLSAGLLKKHMQNHKKVKRNSQAFECKQCDRSFLTCRVFYEHVQCHRRRKK